MNVDPSMPVGSTSKTYNPRTDGQFWNQEDSGREWTQSSASSSQCRPKLRHEKYYPSVAGDTSEASTAMHRLGSIVESDGDAVRAWTDKPWYRQQCLASRACVVLESMCRTTVLSQLQPDRSMATCRELLGRYLDL